MTPVRSSQPREIPLITSTRFVKPVLMVHPEFGSGPAPLPDAVRPGQGGYVRHLTGKLTTQRGKSREKLFSVIPEYEKRLLQLESFVTFFDEYDLEVTLPETCALSLKAPQHYDLDEGVPLGVPRDPRILDKKIVAAVTKQWREAFSNAVDVKLALPTDTNLGWPMPFSGFTEARPFMLGTLAAAVRRDRDLGMSLSDGMTQLAQFFGRPFIIQASRQQMTAKPQPVLDASGTQWTRNLEGRVRSIFMGSKYAIIWNRRITKLLLAAAMKLPQHTQDRPELQRRIGGWLRDNQRSVIAVDISKFDKGHGGAMLRLFASQAAQISGDPAVEADLMAEVSMPLLTRYGNSVFETTQVVAPQLPSGVSFTTVCGLFFGDVVAQTICKYLPGKCEYLSWGDDLVIACGKLDEPLIDEALNAASRELQLGLEREPSIKYLGFQYGSGKYDVRPGYSIARLVTKMFFPEYLRHYPSTAVGYIARLAFIPDAEKFHREFSARAWRDEFGPKFSYSERSDQLSKAIALSMEEGLDSNALNFLVHGMDSEDSEGLLEGIGLTSDFLSDWLGGAYTDLTDPEAVIRENSSVVSSGLRYAAADVVEHGSARLGVFAAQTAAALNLRYSAGDCVY